MKIETPCVNICKLDGRGICTGCLRSVQEIAAWSRMSEVERSLIMADLSGRDALVGTPCHGVPARVPARGSLPNPYGVNAELLRARNSAYPPSKTQTYDGKN